VIALLAGIFFTARHFADPHRNLIRNDDSEVIQAALLTYFEKNPRFDPQGMEGDFAVANPRFLSPRPAFKNDLESLISACKDDPSRHSHLAELVSLKKSISGQQSFQATEPLSLSKLDLDDRIVLSTVNPRVVLSTDPKNLFNRVGTKGTGRIFASLFPPSYAPDGKSAIIKVALDWTRESSELILLLRKEKQRWKVADLEVVD